MGALLATGLWSDTDTWDDTAVWVDAPTSGGGLTVILANVALLDGRTITPLRTDSTPQTWPAPFNPADTAPYVIDLATFLVGESLDTLTAFSVDVVAANLGVTKGAGTLAPVVDRVNKRIAIWPQVDPNFQGPSYFVAPVPTRLILTFSTVGSSGVPAEAYRRSGVLTIAQVL